MSDVFHEQLVSAGYERVGAHIWDKRVELGEQLGRVLLSGLCWAGRTVVKLHYENIPFVQRYPSNTIIVLWIIRDWVEVFSLLYCTTYGRMYGMNLTDTGDIGTSKQAHLPRNLPHEHTDVATSSDERRAFWRVPAIFQRACIRTELWRHRGLSVHGSTHLRNCLYEQFNMRAIASSS